jgi:RNA polymerase sigma factor (sigma-70 family)
VEPWLAELAAGRHQAAWDLVIERYRRLILATIKRLVHDHDDVMDVFSAVCAALNDNELARLRRFVEEPSRARFSTWLVAVVRNQTIDWLRKRDGRRRPVIPAALSPLQREIYLAVFLDGRSHVEAYESICARREPPVTFQEFLREVRETYRLSPAAASDPRQRIMVDAALDDVAAPAVDPAENYDSARRVAEALASLPPAERVAVQLFVVEGMPAADVARAVGWPNAKMVYNRVYRALDALRVALARVGVGPEHLR